MNINDSRTLDKREKKSFKSRRSLAGEGAVEDNSGCCFGCFGGSSNAAQQESKKSDSRKSAKLLKASPLEAIQQWTAQTYNKIDQVFSSNENCVPEWLPGFQTECQR